VSELDIAVCVKRVPATDTRIRIAGSGAGIETAGVKYILSPYDEFAIEGALRLRDAAGGGRVSLVSFGAAAAQEQLRTGLAMGADSATLLAGDSDVDALATARVLAGWFSSLEEQGGASGLILLGVKAADYDQQQVGPMLGVLLDRPCVTGVVEVELRDGAVRCERETETGVEVVEVELPAVLTVTKGAYEPRFVSLRGIMAARRKPLLTGEAESAPSGAVVERLIAPPARPPGRVVGTGSEAVPELVRLLREEAHAI